MKKRDTLFLTLFLLFFLSFFHRFFVVANYICMGFLCLASLANGSFEQKLQLLKERKYIWFMLAFVVLLVISFLVSENKHDGLLYLSRRAPLLLFPVSIGLLQFSREFRDKILLGFAIIVSVACLFSMGWAIHRVWQENNAAWLYNDALSDFIDQQSIYTSVLVNISIYVFVYFLLYYRLSKFYRLSLVLGIVFLFVMNYLLASRNMMLILYASIITLAIYIVFKRKKYIEGAIMLGALILGIVAIFIFFPKTINRFKELTFTQFNFQSEGKESHYNMDVTPDQWNGANFRLAAWQCGWELFKENPITGTALGDKKDELTRVYALKKFQFAIRTQKNVHNNYLDILISTGIIGFLLFLIGWIVLPFIQLIRYKDGLGLLILFTFSLAMLTENYFDRSIGVMLFGFFVPFLLTASRQGAGDRFPV